jgi:hypothetical protein
VLLLVTVMPGAAAYAVLERDVSLRTTLREIPGRDDARELTVRAVSGLAGAIKRTVETPDATLPGAETCVASSEGSVEPALEADVATPPIAGGVRLALLNLPPPLA